MVEALGGGRKKEVAGRGAKKEEGSYGKDSHTTGRSTEAIGARYLLMAWKGNEGKREKRRDGGGGFLGNSSPTLPSKDDRNCIAQTPENRLDPILSHS